MSILMAASRGLGLTHLNFEMTLGTLATGPGLNAWIVGFHLHIVLAGIFALAYAFFFEIRHDAGVVMGVLAGVLQAVIVGGVLGVLPLIHPRLGTELAAPGYFASALGPGDMALLFLVHMIFGATVGALYGRPLSAGGDAEYVRGY